MHREPYGPNPRRRRRRKGAIALAVAVVATLALAGEAGAVPGPQWVPKGYRLIDNWASPSRASYDYERRDGRGSFDWSAWRTRPGDRRCRARDADRRFTVPSWVRVYGVEGSTFRSLFYGKPIYYANRDYVNHRGIRLLRQEAWGCSRGQYPVLVVVTTYDRHLPPLAMARLIWSMGDS